MNGKKKEDHIFYSSFTVQYQECELGQGGAVLQRGEIETIVTKLNNRQITFLNFLNKIDIDQINLK